MGMYRAFNDKDVFEYVRWQAFCKENTSAEVLRQPEAEEEPEEAQEDEDTEEEVVISTRQRSTKRPGLRKLRG